MHLTGASTEISYNIIFLYEIAKHAQHFTEAMKPLFIQLLEQGNC